MAEKTSRLRQIAVEHADLGDHGRDFAAGTPRSAAGGQGAGGTYRAQPEHVTGGARTSRSEKSPYKLRGGK